MMRKLKPEKIHERSNGNHFQHPDDHQTKNAFKSNTLGRIKRRKKSYTCQTALQESALSAYETSFIIDRSVDYSEGFLQDTSISTNSWYYGKLHIFHEENNENTTAPRRKIGVTTLTPLVDKNTIKQSDTVIASVILRIDIDGSFAYSLMTVTKQETEQLQIPQRDQFYCLNFNDPQQPRFSSIQRLLAYLIAYIDGSFAVTNQEIEQLQIPQQDNFYCLSFNDPQLAYLIACKHLTKVPFNMVA